MSPGYTIERELGGGGMSRVFVAEDRTLGRRVVVKVLPPEMAEGVSSDRFRREIQLAASLQHPHVVPLLNAGAADGLLYFTMPFVEGESLRARLSRDGMLSVEEALRVFREIADALAYAHAHSVVHRDIKPDNVLLSNGHALVTDFGIAKAVAASGGDTAETLTVVGTTLGTPSYMAPELIAADTSADHRVDIYAFGCLAYEVLTGTPPFHGISRQALIKAHFGEIPASVVDRRPEVPSALAAIIAWCLEKDPARPPQTAAELIAGLDAVGVHGTSHDVVARRMAKPAMLIAAGVAFAIVAAGAWWWVSSRSSAVTSTDVVAVLPFRVNGADPSLAYLREGMVDLLAAKLTGEGGPRAVDPRVAVSAWRRAGGSDREDVEPERALTLASSIGAGRLILGTVVGTSRLVTLSVTLQDAPGGRERGRASVEGSPDSLPGLVDALTSRLLAVTAGEEKRLTTRTTALLPALRSYLEGQRQFRRGNYAAAIRHYQSAIEMDSAFALAGLGKFFACGYDLTGACTGRSGTVVAHAGASRLSARDSILLYSLNPRFPNPGPRSEILPAREQAARLLHDSPDAWFSLGDYLMHYSSAFGKLDGLSDAKRAFARAVALDSSFIPALEHLVHIAIFEQDLVSVSRFGALYLAQDSVSEAAPSIRWQVAAASGDSAALRRLLPAIDTMPMLSQMLLTFLGGSTRHWGLAEERAVRALLARHGSPGERGEIMKLRFTLLLDRGRPAEALGVMRELKDLDPRSSWVDHKLVWAGLLLGVDSTAAASTAGVLARSVDVSLNSDSDLRAEQYADGCVAGAWYASLGDDARAAKASARLHRPPVTGDSPLRQASNEECALMIDAIRAVRGRQPQARTLVTSFDSLRRLSPPTALMDEGNLVLARLWEALGEREKAADVAARRTRTPTSGYWSEFYLMEGRNAAAAGQRERAIQAYRRYLSRRADAEPALRPEVERVRKELTRLERAGR